ncbi:MAG: hypothetical protein NUV32_05365 [Exilispira sp.]|jgi:hypothetical protein|nr:hypothetical protein [Exilispira sp.]
MKNENLKFINKNIFKFMLFFLFFSYIILFQINVNAQFIGTVGYNYVNMYSNINTNFLPYIGLSYKFSSQTTNFFVLNSFYYSLDNFFINKLNLDFSYRSSSTFINYYIFYIPFNLFLINEDYYTGNFLFTKFDYQSLKKVMVNFSFGAEYDQLTTNLIKSPVNFFLYGDISLPIGSNILSNSLDITYKTDDQFDYSLIKAILSTKITFFPSINEMIIPKISILGGYSFNNTSGNYVGFSISNLFYSSFSSTMSFSSELHLIYNKFLTSVLADDIDYSEIKEKLLFTVLYSENVNSSHSIDIRILYFPQENSPSNLNRTILEFKNTLFYSSSNIFLIDFLSSFQYTYWFMQNEKNELTLFFELILKFIPNKYLTLLLLNDISAAFLTDSSISEIYAQIKFMVVYFITKNLNLEGLISYKSLNDKVEQDFFEYLFLDISISFLF